MVQEGEKIRNYMRDVIKDDEAFLLLEIKHCGSNQLQYNYWCKGDPKRVLTGIAEIIERQAKQMGLTFDEAIEVMKNMHQIDDAVYYHKVLKRIEKNWNVIE